MIRVLAFVGSYLPGYKGGGPVRSMSNMVSQLKESIQFKIVTRDRDIGDPQPYEGIRSGAWTTVGQAEVFYGDSAGLSLGKLRHVLNTTDYDMLYLNSFFSPDFAIKPFLLHKSRQVPQLPVIIAPRGEFSPGALAIKRLKKAAYLTAAKRAGLYKGVIWHATSELEQEDIRRIAGQDAVVWIAPNISAGADVLPTRPSGYAKLPGALRIVFLSRISRKKNLDGALRIITALVGQVTFDIYGPLEDPGYWAECQALIQEMPPNIRVNYCGPIEHDRVMPTLAMYDLFFCPTHGENFGHVIAEALMAGCPVLLSDQTPWRDLEAAGVGWDLPLERPETFVTALRSCLEMDHQAFLQYKTRAQVYGLRRTEVPSGAEQTSALFEMAVGRLLPHMPESR